MSAKGCHAYQLREAVGNAAAPGESFPKNSFFAGPFARGRNLSLPSGGHTHAPCPMGCRYTEARLGRVAQGGDALLKRFAQKRQRLADVQADQFPAVRFVGMLFEGVWDLALRQDSVECFQALAQADALVVAI